MKHSFTLLLLLACLTAGAQTKQDTTTLHVGRFPMTPNFTSGRVVSTADTSLIDFSVHPLSWQPAKFIWFNTPDEILSISAPKNDTITVKFNRKYVKFINDSTFIFKQPK